MEAQADRERERERDRECFLLYNGDGEEEDEDNGPYTARTPVLLASATLPLTHSRHKLLRRWEVAPAVFAASLIPWNNPRLAASDASW